MAKKNRKYNLVETVKSDVVLITGKIAGTGASDPTLPEATQFGGGEVIAAHRVSAGLYTLTLAAAYPHLEAVVACNLIGTAAIGTTTNTTAGLKARVIAISSAAIQNDGLNGQLTVLCEVGATPTDLGTSDHVHITLAVRKSGRNQ